MKKCDNDCCGSCLDDYDEIEEDYEIQRLKDIIKICEYLIQVRTHKIEKRKIIDNLCDGDKDAEEDKEDKTHVVYHTYPYHYYINKHIPWWDVWF